MTPARRVTNLIDRYDGDLEGPVQPGDFEITTDSKTGQKFFWFICPGPCQSLAALHLRPVVSTTSKVDSWDLLGDESAPTLQPSINHVNCWHGWLTDGRFKLCGEA